MVFYGCLVIVIFLVIDSHRVFELLLDLSRLLKWSLWRECLYLCAPKFRVVCYYYASSANSLRYVVGMSCTSPFQKSRVRLIYHQHVLLRLHPHLAAITALRGKKRELGHTFPSVSRTARW